MPEVTGPFQFSSLGESLKPWCRPERPVCQGVLPGGHPESETGSTEDAFMPARLPEALPLACLGALWCLSLDTQKVICFSCFLKVKITPLKAADVSVGRVSLA